MSDHFASSSRDEDVTSTTSSKSHQPIWMSNCNNRSSKPGSTVENSALICYNEGHIDMRNCLTQTGLKTKDGFQYGKGVSKGAGEIQTRIVNQNLTKKLGNLENNLSDSSFPTLSLGRNKGKASTVGNQMDHEFGDKSTALALAVCQEGTSREINLRSSEQQPMSHLYQEQKGIAGSRSHTYDKSNASKHFSNDNFTCFSQDRCKYQKSSSVLFHEKKMENNICHESGRSDGLHLHHGYSPGQKNFQSFFLKKRSQSGRGQPLHRVPCSFHNVETMRICTMIDSMENSPGDPPKVSQRAHHILFTKETCVNLSKDHQLIREPTSGHQEGKTFGGSFSHLASHARGVKIQPLWTSTDSEKEPSGSPSTCKAGSWNEASAETDGVQAESTLGHRGEKRPFGGLFSMYPNGSSHSRGVKIQPLWTSTDSEEKENTGNISFGRAGSKNEASAETDGMSVDAPKKQRILMGMESSPLNQDDTVDENSPKAACDSSTEKARSKRPMTEIPDINEEPPGIQPEVSSTDGKEPSSSRVHSLNAKQLFSCHEQTSRSVCNARQESSLGPDTSNRWIKRLKVSSSDSFGVGTKSSDIGEGSSHEKCNTFFNRIMKCNRVNSDAKLRKQHGKEQMSTDQNVESLRSGGSSSMGSKKRSQSTTQGCSWIQRWCQSCTEPPPSNPEPLVICEPRSLKFRPDDVTKKQFPSIAAMALMGKAMNGVSSCEFKKRGPVVVWNTKEY